MATELVERTTFGADFDRVAYTHEVVDALARHQVDLVAMAGFGTILEKPIHDAYPDRIVNTHPALLPAFKGWHAVDDALAAGVKVTGCTVHMARPRGRRGPDPRAGGGAGPARRHRRDAARADQGSRTPHLPGGAPDVARRRERERESLMRTKITRALLSVYDKTGIVEFARELQRARRRARVVGRHRHGDRRGRHPGHRGRRHHRRPADPRPPGRHAPPEDPRRDPRRPRRRRRTTRTWPPTASSRSTSWCRTSTRSRGTPTSRPSTSAARRWCGRRRRTTRSSPSSPTRRSTRRCSRSCDANDNTVGDDTRRALARRRVRQHRGVRRRDRRLAASATTSCPQYIDLALERTGEAAALRREPAPARGALPHRGHHELVGRRRAARRPRAQLPQPLRRRRRVAPRARPALTGAADGPAVAIIKHANPCGVAVADDLATAVPARARVRRAVRVRRHRRAQPPGRRRHRRAHGRRPPGRPRDRARLRAGHHRRADREAQEHAPARARGPPEPQTLDFRQISGGFLVQDAAPLRGHPRRLAGRHQARAHRAPSGATPSWRGASAAT